MSSLALSSSQAKTWIEFLFDDLNHTIFNCDTDRFNHHLRQGYLPLLLIPPPSRSFTWSPLMTACSTGSPYMVETLKVRGYQINLTPLFGWSYHHTITGTTDPSSWSGLSLGTGQTPTTHTI